MKTIKYIKYIAKNTLLFKGDYEFKIIGFFGWLLIISIIYQTYIIL